MQNNRVWQRACGLTRTVVEGVRVDDEVNAIVVSVRPDARARSRCGRCGRRSPGYDRGAGRRRWRGLDAGTTRVLIEADAPRVQCRTHGQTVAQVPWARHGAGHTRDFDAMAAWLAVRTSKSATCQLLRVAWRTIGSIITRVNDDVEATIDRLAGLRRIGIDEISYKRSHRYLIVVVDHDTGRLVWAGPGRSQAVLNVFFDELGDQRRRHDGAVDRFRSTRRRWRPSAITERSSFESGWPGDRHGMTPASYSLVRTAPPSIRRRSQRYFRTGFAGRAYQSSAFMICATPMRLSLSGRESIPR